MKTVPYPIATRLASRVPEWEQDIAFTLRAAETDPVHGTDTLRACLQALQRDFQAFMVETDEDTCEGCGAPPEKQHPDAVRDLGCCRLCGAVAFWRPITVRPITREDDDIGF